MYIFIGAIAFVVLIAVTWRFASRRHSIPCPVWLRWLVELDNPFTTISRAGAIVDHLGVEPGMFVADVGCGPGRVTVPVARKVGPGGKVLAVDIQTGMLDRAKAKAQASNLSNIEFLLAGAGEGKIGRAQFDRALLVTVLGEIPDRKAALHEIFDVLKPGGILSVTEIIFDPHFQGRRTVSRIANEVGFREREFFGNRVAFTLNLEKPQTH